LHATAPRADDREMTTDAAALLAERTSRAMPLQVCPACDGRQLAALTTRAGVVFRCAGCGTAWRFELGFVRPEP
jgi:hypothetical protein